MIVAGAVAQRPRPGHAWVFLQWLLGLRRLGCDVAFVDRLPGDAAWLGRAMDRFGVPHALLDEGGRAVAGLSDDELRGRVRGSTLLNVTGYLRDERLLDLAARRVYVDLDPGFPQMWRELGLADVLAGHDRFVTVGRNVGRSRCGVPTCGLDWIGTAPPVVLEEWPVAGRGSRFTTIASWRGAFAPVEYRGGMFGLRVHEFRKFAELPRLAGGDFELALDIDPAETRDLELLRSNGWLVVDPARVAPDLDGYRAYVRGSAAELMVAKSMYVQTRSGWFSDRSACYLAAGKPVLAQDTGLRDHYPTGEGLVVFSTLDEAVAGVETIRADYARHSRAARELAEAAFHSDRVLGSLLEELER